MNRVIITAWINNKAKASNGYKTGFDFAEDEKKLIIFSKSIPSPGRITASCGSRNIGILTRTPVINSNKRLAGFFCLNISITDIGSISFVYLLLLFSQMQFYIKIFIVSAKPGE
jgi:hypothetical protein